MEHDDFIKVLNEIEDVYNKKDDDYGRESIESVGVAGTFLLIYMNTLSIKNLLKNNKETSFELIRNSLLNIAKYSILSIIEMDKHGDNKQDI